MNKILVAGAMGEKKPREKLNEKRAKKTRIESNSLIHEKSEECSQVLLSENAPDPVVEEGLPSESIHENRSSKERSPEEKEKRKKEKREKRLKEKELKREKRKSEEMESEPKKEPKTEKEMSVWIGNLFFRVKKNEIEEFFKDCGEITKIDMPVNKQDPSKNNGFAFVYFSTVEATVKAVKKSEQVLFQRKVLIKCGTDYTRKGRPANKNARPTLFVGNLPFSADVKKLKSIFSKHGKIAKVRVATFEDSGKCKGFGYIDYCEVESSKKALREKYFLDGRKLRVEYGSDVATRKGRPWEYDKEE